jgi:CDP-paratose 2-epimerase
VKSNRILITGGAGFIGSNLANRLLAEGHYLTILDNLSRSGCEANIIWLQEKHGAESFRLVHADLTDFDAVKNAVNGIDRIYHLAKMVR